VVSATAKAASPEKPAKPGAAEKLAKLGEKVAALEAAKATAADPEALKKVEADIVAAKKDITATEKAKAKAEKDMAEFGNQTTSMMGLEKPFFLLKNPGLISIPLGFLCVIVFSLAFRDKRSEEMWDELYVRQNTGIHAEGATAH
jgi:cation/acetate symporter